MPGRDRTGDGVTPGAGTVCGDHEAAELAASLEQGVLRDGKPLDQAATRLLIDHGGWLRDRQFRRACTEDGNGECVNWNRAREFAGRAERSPWYPAGDMAILKIACMIALDENGLRALDQGNREHAADALSRVFTAVLGVELHRGGR